MHDWLFEPGPDPLSLNLAGQPGSPDPGAANWFPPAPADDFGSWLFGNQPKGDLDGFGPMFVEGEGEGEGDDDDGGAHELDEVDVTGSRIERFPTAVQVTIGDVFELPPVEVGGGGWSPPPNPYDRCEDRAADTLADDINDEITRQPDSDRREYGALIWRDDAGNLHRTALVPGTNDRVDWPADSSTLGLDSYSRVVGMVHSHPTMVDLGGGRWVSATHTGIHGGDWAAADGWVTMHNLDRANFTMYISDRGTVREYVYADNTSNSRSVRTDRGSVESGDYNPGSSCP